MRPCCRPGGEGGWKGGGQGQSACSLCLFPWNYFPRPTHGFPGTTHSYKEAPALEGKCARDSQAKRHLAVSLESLPSCAVLVFASRGSPSLGGIPSLVLSPRLLALSPCRSSFLPTLLPLPRGTPSSSLNGRPGTTSSQASSTIMAHSFPSRQQLNGCAEDQSCALLPTGSCLSPAERAPSPFKLQPWKGVCSSLASNRETFTHRLALPTALRHQGEVFHISLSEKYNSPPTLILPFAMPTHVLSWWSQ